MPNLHGLMPYEDPSGQPHSVALQPEKNALLMHNCNGMKDR
jgi:hypothetical protein